METPIEKAPLVKPPVGKSPDGTRHEQEKDMSKTSPSSSSSGSSSSGSSPPASLSSGPSPSSKKSGSKKSTDKQKKDNYVWLYDSTLRDGAQTRGVDFSVTDKLTIARLFDDFGIDYIEGGWPGSNPVDDNFFDQIGPLKNSRLTAFGMTRRAGMRPESDVGLARLGQTACSDVCIVGKTWAFQVEQALGIDLQENLKMIGESITFLRKAGKSVLFDAEHFFDGWKEAPDYTRACIEQARQAGARWVVLCDTNGGTLSDEIEKITSDAVRIVDGSHLAIHCHDDTDHATANSLAAVRAGARQVQGTFNGLGERCGNANLVSILPALTLKMGFTTAIDATKLQKLREISGQIDEGLNRPPDPRSPYIGDYAFSHKGGLHASAVGKNPRCYEHMDPASVGNRRHVLVSIQSGKTLILSKLKNMGIIISKSDQRLAQLLETIKQRSLQGYSYDGAEASFEILARDILGQLPSYFTIDRYRIVNEHQPSQDGTYQDVSKASVHVTTQARTTEAHATGNGPVHALDNALRKALIPNFPLLEDLKLMDYKVRILSPSSDTSATTRVIIGCSDGRSKLWQTIGVSTNVIDASRIALVDAFVWKLFDAESGHVCS